MARSSLAVQVCFSLQDCLVLAMHLTVAGCSAHPEDTGADMSVNQLMVTALDQMALHFSNTMTMDCTFLKNELSRLTSAL